MLEGQQIFFILFAFLYFLIIFKNENIKFYQYLILSLLIGIAIAIKINSMILCLLFVILIIKEKYNEIKNLNFSFKTLKDVLVKVITVIAGIFFIIFIVFYIHFALGKKVINYRYYSASNKYKEIMLN
jgi:dolichyl-phosphate-mannose--protein O-mannosyl transferase